MLDKARSRSSVSKKEVFKNTDGSTNNDGGGGYDDNDDESESQRGRRNDG